MFSMKNEWISFNKRHRLASEGLVNLTDNTLPELKSVSTTRQKVISHSTPPDRDRDQDRNHDKTQTRPMHRAIDEDRAQDRDCGYDGWHRTSKNLPEDDLPVILRTTSHHSITSYYTISRNITLHNIAVQCIIAGAQSYRCRHVCC